VGLITGLMSLPLAPVKGVVWIAERLLEQAEQDFYGEAAIRRQLDDLEVSHELGEIDDQEYAQAQDELVHRLMEGRRKGVAA